MTTSLPAHRRTAAQRRAQILLRAGELFGTRGLAGTRVREIADACGVTEATLYKHFPSKDAIFEAALAEKIAEYDNDAFLAGIPADAPLLEVFEKVARRILDVGIGDESLHRLLLAASLAGTGTDRGTYVTWRLPFVKYLEARVADGVAAGRLRPVDPLLTARAFVGLVMDCVLHCHLWSAIGEPQPEPGGLVENNVPIFVRGLMRDPD